MKRTLEYIITKEFHNKSILFFLQHMDFCHQTIVFMKKTPNGIMLNNIWVHVNHVLSENDLLTLSWEEENKESNIMPSAMALNIVYEDEDILVINKEANTPIHPSMGNHDNTLANGIMYYFSQKGENFTYRCMNRLDRDTTGLTIIAKNCQSAGILSRSIQIREIHRTYLAICEGFVEEHGTINAPIARKEASTIERCVDTENGESAITHYQRIGYNKDKNISLVKLRLETGRTHQIRVHMKYINHPLIGDFLYNPNMKDMSRQALHSYSLEFIHPITKKKLYLTASLPKDMQDLFPSNKII